MTVPHSDPAQPVEPDRLHRLAAAMDEAVGTLAAVWGGTSEASVPVPATQLRVLFIVERHGSINLSGLAAELGALPSSASRLCDRLEAAGLLVRVPGRDRRVISLRLSRDGTLLLDRLRERRRADLAGVLARMSPSARTALLTGLLQFHTAATEGKATEGKAPDEPADVSRPA
ncbi:MarR family transcriptional regulator [Actinomadura sp. NPDC047616]|uniref:MarR family winged helix-turn-helix transcriptional regulator n=1 Tax=Actinomadura sp. NPDC047616 TaxID=3155914 RepID=UPI00341182B7